MFEPFYQEGDLLPDVRVLLIERQVALGLQPEQVRQIESRAQGRMSTSQGPGK
jgi:hypothetical protein